MKPLALVRALRRLMGQAAPIDASNRFGGSLPMTAIKSGLARRENRLSRQPGVNLADVSRATPPATRARARWNT